ncbi:MAG: hypothetical protein WCL16_09215 [bacterium]
MAKLESIQCPACGEASLLKRAPRYDDNFRKVGEHLTCAACGHVFAGEAAVVFTKSAASSLFNDDERPKALRIFDDDEHGGTCLHCRNYLVNPFTQRCGLHNRVVEATDTCGQFAVRPDES